MEVDYNQYDTGEINIKETYSFYFRINDEGISRDMKPSEFADQVKLISSFNKLETFWAIYQHLRKPDNCKFGTEIYLFVRDIKPLWEDPQNANGGKISVRLRKKYTTIIWEELILGFIGEIFPPQIQSEITGLVISIRRDCNLLQVWFKDYSYDKGVLIEDAIKQYLQIPENVDVETKPFFKNYFGVPNNLSTEEKIKEKYSRKKSTNANNDNIGNINLKENLEKCDSLDKKEIKTSVDLLFELDEKQMSSNLDIIANSLEKESEIKNENVNNLKTNNSKPVEDIEVVKILVKEGDLLNGESQVKSDSYYNNQSNSMNIKYEYGYENKNYYNNYYKNQNQIDSEGVLKKDEFNNHYKNNYDKYNNSYYNKGNYYQNYQSSNNQGYGYHNTQTGQNSNYVNSNNYRAEYNNSYNDYNYKKTNKRGK